MCSNGGRYGIGRLRDAYLCYGFAAGSIGDRYIIVAGSKIIYCLGSGPITPQVARTRRSSCRTVVATEAAYVVVERNARSGCCGITDGQVICQRSHTAVGIRYGDVVVTGGQAVGIFGVVTAAPCKVVRCRTAIDR